MSEDDVWSIFGDIVAGARAFRDVNLHHGDIQPQNCFVLDDKTIKLLDSCFLNDYPNAFQRTYTDPQYKSALSPEAMKGLLLGPDHQSFDKEKNDIWGIGKLKKIINKKRYNCFDVDYK